MKHLLKKKVIRRLAAPLLIVMVGILAYANSFSVPFVLDDLESIVGNQAIRDLRNFLPGGSGYDFHFRRSIVYFTFALNYHFGGLSVFGYHLFNLAVHLATALLVYLFLQQTFRTPVLIGSRLGPQRTAISLLAALFFVAHPIQTQAVTYIVQRLASLCSFFYLLAVVLYVAARLRMAALEAGRQHGDLLINVPATLLLGGSVASAVMAMFCKEIAFTLPVAVLLYEASFFRGNWRRRILILLPLLLTILILPMLTLDPAQAGHSLQVQTRTGTSWTVYLLTQFRVIISYIRLLILPVNQNLDYAFPLFSTFLTPPVFFSFLVLAGMVVSAMVIYGKTVPAGFHGRQATDPAARLIGFGILWFFLTLSVESSIIPLADVIFEHRLYLPSIGFAAALAATAVLIWQRYSSILGRSVPLCAAAGVIFALCLATGKRNMIWQNEVHLWRDTVQKSPGKIRPLYNLGTYLGDRGQAQEAVEILKRVVAMDPLHADGWHNLGRSYLLLGRKEDAMPALKTAVRLKPEMENAILNLTVLLIQSGQYREAIELLEKARQRFPDSPGVHMNLGLAYSGAGNRAAGQKELAVLQRLDQQLARLLEQDMKKSLPPLSSNGQQEK